MKDTFDLIDRHRQQLLCSSFPCRSSVSAWKSIYLQHIKQKYINIFNPVVRDYNRLLLTTYLRDSSLYCHPIHVHLPLLHLRVFPLYLLRPSVLSFFPNGPTILSLFFIFLSTMPLPFLATFYIVAILQYNRKFKLVVNSFYSIVLTL